MYVTDEFTIDVFHVQFCPDNEPTAYVRFINVLMNSPNEKDSLVRLSENVANH